LHAGHFDHKPSGMDFLSAWTRRLIFGGRIFWNQLMTFSAC
jgi:hypothetical protein